MMPHPRGLVANWAGVKKADAHTYGSLQTSVDWILVVGSCCGEICAEKYTNRIVWNNAQIALVWHFLVNTSLACRSQSCPYTWSTANLLLETRVVPTTNQTTCRLSQSLIYSYVSVKTSVVPIPDKQPTCRLSQSLIYSYVSVKTSVVPIPDQQPTCRLSQSLIYSYVLVKTSVVPIPDQQPTCRLSLISNVMTSNISADISMNGQKSHEVTSFKYLEATLCKDGTCSAEVHIKQWQD